MNTSYDILIIGGGAAGFFCAINIAEKAPHLKIAILERGKEVLTKVKISGGGRCNVTHAEFLPSELIRNYPRGKKELLGPFHSFMTGDTVSWFQKRGVMLKIEEDGRMFPVTDSSQTIIDCFLAETQRLGINVLMGQSVKEILNTSESFKIITTSETFLTRKVVIATGSNPKIWNLLEQMGHTIVPPVPSLFTFNIKDERIIDLPGVATHAQVSVLSKNNKVLLQSEGPLLITHWGMSGPAILKLSAWGARFLEPLKYHFNIEINWLNDLTKEETLEQLLVLKETNPKQTLFKYPQLNLPKRLWQNLLKASGIAEAETWAAVSKKQLQNRAHQLTQSPFQVTGKSTF